MSPWVQEGGAEGEMELDTGPFGSHSCGGCEYLGKGSVHSRPWGCSRRQPPAPSTRPRVPPFCRLGLARTSSLE